MKLRFDRHTAIGIALLFAIAIVLFLAVFCTSTNCVISNSVVRTEGTFAAIETVCERYKIDYGTLPSSAENYVLVGIFSGNNPEHIVFWNFQPSMLNANRELIDGRGTPLRIAFLPDSSVSVRSAGRDRSFGTHDDMLNR